MFRNYLNYSGSKDRIYPILRTYLEKATGKNKDNTLIDMFAGSCVVAYNSLDLFKEVVCVDKCVELIKIHDWIASTPLDKLLEQIRATIDKYELSKENKVGFLQLREDYNTGVASNKFDACELYCLIMHSYNYQLHTNKKREFNAPSGAGRSWFNPSIEQKLINMKNHLSEVKNKPVLLSGDVLSLIDKDNKTFREATKNDFSKMVFYVDPPYSASVSKHPYRVGNVKWDVDEDRKLFDCLDYIHKNSGKFILSNVTTNNGIRNIPLQRWAGKYNLNPIEVQYTNCSYQRKNGGKTEEVIITNFD